MFQENIRSRITNKCLEEAFTNLINFNSYEWMRMIEYYYRTEIDWYKKKLSALRSVELAPLKSNAEAARLRLRGNNKHICGLDYEAHQLFTQSIALAEDGSVASALSYGNRSASLYRRGKFVECILDINRALEGHYPNELREKLKHLKRHCLAMIQRMGENEQRFGRTAGISEIEDLTDAPHFDDDEEWRLLCRFGNSLIPHSSPKIKIERNEQWGRHIVATEDVEPGEILSCQKFFLTSVKPDKVYKNCSYCLKRCYTLIPCALCNEMYCSKLCCSQAKESYHWMECKLFRLQRRPYFEAIQLISVKAVRALLVGTKQGTQLKRLMEEWKTTDIFTENSNLKNEPFVDDYKSVLRMRRTFDLSSLEKAVPEVVQSVVMLKCVGFYENAGITDCTSETDKNCLNEVELFTAVLLLNHCNTLTSNLFGPIEISNWNMSNNFCIENVGAGVCSLHALLNHSCNPNVHFLMKNREHVLFAARPIKKDEQIFTIYCGNFAKRDHAGRQQELRQYGFTCQCEACSNNWPVLPLNHFRNQKPTFSIHELVAADFHPELQPIFKRVTEKGFANLSARGLLQIVSQILKWIHANEKSPSFVIVECETQLAKLMMLLFNDSSREYLNASGVEVIFTIIFNCISKFTRNRVFHPVTCPECH